MSSLTLSCPGTGRALVKIGHSNLWPGSKELTVRVSQHFDVWLDKIFQNKISHWKRMQTFSKVWYTYMKESKVCELFNWIELFIMWVIFCCVFICRCIVTCIADPNTYLMDHLLTLKPVKFLEGELIHDVSAPSMALCWQKSLLS